MAQPAQQFGWGKKIWGEQNVWFYVNNTILLRKTCLKAQNDYVSKNLWGHGSFGPPRYAYGFSKDNANLGTYHGRLNIKLIIKILHIIYFAYYVGIITCTNYMKSLEAISHAKIISTNKDLSAKYTCSLQAAPYQYSLHIIYAQL